MGGTANRRARTGATLLTLMMLAGIVAWPADVAEARGGSIKYTICHRTNAVKNPYRRISVAWGALAAHEAHTGPVFNVADPASNKGTKWGDVFSHRKNNTTNGQLRQVNWPDGQAVFDGAEFTHNGTTRQACRTLTTTEFVRSEHEEGTPLPDIMTDLDEQQASEDLPVLSALGMSFSEWFAQDPTRSIDDLIAGLDAAMPSATTGAATDVTSTSATLHGTVDAKGATATLFFDHGTSSMLTTATSAAATPSSVTASTPEPATLALTGLSPATTYSYRFVASISSGSGDTASEQDVIGSIRSFTTPGLNAPAVTTASLPAGEVGQAYEAQLTAEGGTLPYASWKAAGLPDGLTVDPDAGIISGTPTQAGTAEVLASVAGADGARSATHALALTVLPPPTPVAKAERTLTIDVDHASREPGGVATVSARPSAGGGTITYSLVSGGADCVLDGPQVTAATAATCSIWAHITEDEAYQAATSDDVTVTFAAVEPGSTSNTIEFAALDDRTIGDAPFEVSATASSGLEVTFTSETSGTCTVTDRTVTMIAAGVCQVTAAQPGGALPDDGGTAPAAVPVTRSFNVVKQPNVLDFPAVDDRVVGAADFTLPITSSSGLTPQVVSTTPEVCTVEGLTVTLVGAGTCSLVASQDGDDAVAPALPVTRRFTVAPADVDDTTLPPGTDAPTDQTPAPAGDEPATDDGSGATPPTDGTPPTDPSPGTDTDGPGDDISPPTDDTKPPTDDTKPPTDDTKPPTDDTKPPTGDTKPPTGDSSRTPNLRNNRPPPSFGEPGRGATPSGAAGRTPLPSLGSPRPLDRAPIVIVHDPQPTSPTSGHGSATLRTGGGATSRHGGIGVPRGVNTRPSVGVRTRQTRQRAPEDAVSDPVDFGRGPVAAASGDDGSAARRSLFGLRRESLHGFAPDTGATVEILGSRTAGQFLLSSLESVDVAAVAAALRESIPRNGTEFAWLDDAAVGTAPPRATLPPRVDAERDRAFAASGLTAPQVLSADHAAAGRHWLQVQGSVDGYRPGSTVYLAVTSDPLLVAEAVVDRYGRAQVAGSFPLEVVGAGGHSIRLIGTRSLNGVTVDESGQVRLARTTLAEIRRFDAGTHATVTVVGVNATGGGHTAVRIVPLDLRPPWWTLLVVIVVALTAAVARRRRRLGTRRRLVVASAVITAASAPALVLGWFAITYAVMGWGALLAVLGVAVLRLVPQRRRADDADGTADAARPAPREPRWLVTSGAGSVD